MSTTHVLIAGARGGIGRALTEAVQRRGWTPVLVGRDPAELRAGAAGGATIVADLSTPEGARAALETCVREHGVPRGFANCAGALFVAPLHRTDEAQYRACLRANLDTSFFGLKAWVEALRAAKVPGAAVLVSSVAARIGVPNHEAIAAAKSAVEGLVRSAAATYAADGLRINAVAPGLVDTPAAGPFLRSEAGRRTMAAQYPLGRIGQAREIAAAIAWLLSDDAAWTTGQVLGVDGGFTAVRPPVRIA
jgi:NAD(P)-dependent dehydrogenase (short-subunit alcohol dehydrogenase family)